MRPSARPAATAGRMGIEGKWRITEMELWDREAIDLLGPAFIEFAAEGGSFRFIAVDGQMSCEHGERRGRPHVTFTWEGSDECDPASGHGSATLRKDGTLAGRLFIRGPCRLRPPMAPTCAASPADRAGAGVTPSVRSPCTRGTLTLTSRGVPRGSAS